MAKQQSEIVERFLSGDALRAYLDISEANAPPPVEDDPIRAAVALTEAPRREADALQSLYQRTKEARARGDVGPVERGVRWAQETITDPAHQALAGLYEGLAGVGTGIARNLY